MLVLHDDVGSSHKVTLIVCVLSYKSLGNQLTWPREFSFLALPAQHAEEDTVVWRWITCSVYGLKVLWYYRGSILSSSHRQSSFDYLIQMLGKDSDTASFFISHTLWSAWDLGNSHRFINDPDFLSLCFPLFLRVVWTLHHLENNYGIRQQKDPFPSCISTSSTISGIRKRN